MSKVKRVYVEKQSAYAVKAKELNEEIRSYLGIKTVTKVRVLVRYDVENISEDTYKRALKTVFAELPVDIVYEEKFPYEENDRIFSVEYLPGQFDQRADSAVQCVKFLNENEEPVIKTAMTYVITGELTQEQFEQAGGEGTVASWRNTVTVENVHPNTTVSFRMNNLSGSAADLKLYAYGADGKLAEVSKELWTITDESGTGVDTLTDGTLYELRVSVADDGALDLSEAEKEIIISVVLSK